MCCHAGAASEYAQFNLQISFVGTAAACCKKIAAQAIRKTVGLVMLGLVASPFINCAGTKQENAIYSSTRHG